MAFSVQMPALGESVTEGTVTRWLKQEGDTVEVDEPLLEVSTDKVDTEIPSPAAGVLTKIVAQEDDTVEVGGELAVIGEAGEGDGEAPAAQEKTEEPEPQPEPEPEPAPAAQGAAPRGRKKVGDTVEVEEPLVEVSTDKVDTEIPSPVAGTLLSITAEEDDTVPVGGELAKIGEAGAAAAEEPAPKPAPPAEAEPAPPPKAEPKPNPEARPERAPEPKPEAAPQPGPQPAAAATPSGPSAEAGPYVTPLVRKLANENNIDLATGKGTGVGGRIRKQDVLAAAEAKKAPPAREAPAAEEAPVASTKAPAAAPTPAAALAHLRGTPQKASRIRQLTAKKTRESLQATAQLTQTHEVDVTKIVALRATAKARFAEQEGVNLTFLPFFARAAIDALKTHPNVNASYK